MNKIQHSIFVLILAIVMAVFANISMATLLPIEIYNGNVGMSIDAVGSNNSPVGNLQAEIPTTATILKAYLYAAGTPYPWYSDSPRTTVDYNGAGITLNGTTITNFDTIVGATSDRIDIGQWYTGRADVTSLVQSLAIGGPSYSWQYTEGSALNNRIDGGVLAIIYEDASLPNGSVVFLDGGQTTGGESTHVHFGNPLGDTTAADFYADMSLAISFSVGDAQSSIIDINGSRLSSSAGGYDDGTFGDGGLLTAGGIGDSNNNPSDPFSTLASLDDELYTLVPFLSQGDTAFTIFTQNNSDDDNIFFMALNINAMVSEIHTNPEPATLALLGLGLSGLGFARRKTG